MKNEIRDNLCKEVYAQGFNIYMLIGRMKKQLNMRVAIPDEVIIDVCRDFLKRSGKVANHWSYFVKVFALTSSKYFANQRVSEGEAMKKSPMPEKLKQILRQL